MNKNELGGIDVNKQNVEIWESIREIDDSRIRDFIDLEKDRLGNLLQGFTISWDQAETEYRLVLYSEGSQDPITDQSFSFGIGLKLGSVPQLMDGCDTLTHIQQAGCAFYDIWEKEIKNLKCNLGKQKSESNSCRLIIEDEENFSDPSVDPSCSDTPIYCFAEERNSCAEYSPELGIENELDELEREINELDF